ncbi:MAG: UbiA family prenyltransferase [Burkholderiaceae bacterium]|nr:MAG: UbiA family prenyltransferase [Burkholderiaceae bacterium]
MSEPQGHSASDNVPLFVDLDGTLIKSDLLVESTFALIKQSPTAFLSMPGWLIQGKARLKRELAQRTTIDVTGLPLQESFVAYLREQARVRPVYLATASDIIHAQRVADHLGFFAGVLASNGANNLKGNNKLQEILKVSNGGPFDYAADAVADLPIWAKARRAILVNPAVGVRRAASKIASVEHVFNDRPVTWRTWMRALRVHQWAKNSLLAVPLLTAHLFTPAAVATTLIAFAAFGLVASATYLLNDLLDLAADRHHPRKRLRPFAAGNLTLPAGVLALIVFLAGGLALAAALSSQFLLVLLVYLGLTLAYSLCFKTYMLLDVLLLAALYTVRIIAGASAIQVPLSSWLLAFSMFLFLSLALVKRSAELLSLKQVARDAATGRDYQVTDYGMLSAMGIAAGYVAVLVLALFVDSTAGQGHYMHPRLLWLLCPAMLYWISRVWMKTARGEMHDDPIVFSLRDRASWLVFVSMILTMLIAI